MKRWPISTLPALAIWKGYSRIVAALLQGTSWTNPRQDLQRDFLQLCEQVSGPRLEPLLRFYGCSLVRPQHYQGSYTPLHHACMTGNLSVMQILSRYGKSWDWDVRVEGTGATPLHMFGMRFVRGYYQNSPSTNGVKELEWIWRHHQERLLLVEDGNGKAALQCILGRLCLDAQRLCVLKLLALRSCTLVRKSPCL